MTNEEKRLGAIDSVFPRAEVLTGNMINSNNQYSDQQVWDVNICKYTGMSNS